MRLSKAEKGKPHSEEEAEEMEMTKSEAFQKKVSLSRERESRTRWRRTSLRTEVARAWVGLMRNF